MITCHGNARLHIIFFHLRFILYPWHIFYLKTTADIKICAQFCIPFQPILIIGFQPINTTMLKGQKCHSPIYFILILQTADLIIFIQAILQFLCQLIIRLIPNSQYIHSIVFQLPAKLPIVCRKIGRDKNKVFHILFLPFSAVFFHRCHRTCFHYRLPLRFIFPDFFLLFLYFIYSKRYGRKYTTCLYHQGQSWAQSYPQ